MIITEYRLRAGLSQDVLASMVGVTASTISHIEQRRRRPSIPLLAKLVKALGIDAKDLYDLVLSYTGAEK